MFSDLDDATKIAQITKDKRLSDKEHIREIWKSRIQPSLRGASCRGETQVTVEISTYQWPTIKNLASELGFHTLAGHSRPEQLSGLMDLIISWDKTLAKLGTK